ncbi:VOC family protein [Pseudonocardia sp. TRM90224]|uniref:VOC family protein n=1 Tax=Pseudonocardia sp. TRM90224 TaxID=2812678 RepID=UPI001E2E8F64|nr:VOC family protein [Pseudonocardia sp. TRM90224]
MTCTRLGPPDPRLDHLVYATPELDAAVAAFAAASGVEPVEGGRHVGRGTRNYLVGLGPTSFLEIIGPDRDNPVEPGNVPFGIGTLTGPRLVTWAVAPADIDKAVAAAGIGPIEPMARRTPAGALLEWRLTSSEASPPGVPFLIDWGTTPHPAAALPRIGLTGLGATVPEPAAAAELLTALDVTLPVEAGPQSLVALLDTPRGPVTLT